MSRSSTLRITLLLAIGLAGCDRAPHDAAAPTPASATPATTPPAPAPSTAAADTSSPRAAVIGSMDRFLAARSFHASLQMQGPHPLTSEMDFVAPDRYRIQMPVGTQLIIGDTLYMEIDGKRQQMPLPAGSLAQWRDPLQLDRHKDGVQVEALGSDSLDGEPTRKFRVTQAESGHEEMLYWLDAQGRPRRIRQSGQTHGAPYTVTIDYSRFDDPGIHIDSP